MLPLFIWSNILQVMFVMQKHLDLSISLKSELSISLRIWRQNDVYSPEAITATLFIQNKQLTQLQRGFFRPQIYYQTMRADYQQLQYHGTQPIEIIHTVSFNWDNSCVALATNKGFRILSTEPLRLKQHRDLGVPLQFVEMYERSNFLAFVGFENTAFLANRVAIFDDNQNNIIADASFQHNVLAVKIRLDKLVVALSSRIYILDFFSLQIIHVIPTLTFPEAEPYSLISISNDPNNLVLACPGLDLGQILLIHIEQERQRHIQAHQSNLSNIVVTLNGDKVATASEKGMNIRIFNTSTGEMLQEVRRGNQYGQIYSLSFSRAGNWMACCSDSDIVHVFASDPSPEARQMRYHSNQVAYTNPKSKLYFLRKLLPYFDAEYSYCQYKMPDFEPELTSIACFGFHDDNLLVINDYGSFKRVSLNLKGGTCNEVLEVNELLQMKKDKK